MRSWKNNTKAAAAVLLLVPFAIFLIVRPQIQIKPAVVAEVTKEIPVEPQKASTPAPAEVATAAPVEFQQRMTFRTNVPFDDVPAELASKRVAYYAPVEQPSNFHQASLPPAIMEQKVEPKKVEPKKAPPRIILDAAWGSTPEEKYAFARAYTQKTCPASSNVPEPSAKEVEKIKAKLSYVPFQSLVTAWIDASCSNIVAVVKKFRHG